jgi:hypothetical protein
VKVYGSTFESNTATSVSNSEAVLRTFLNFLRSNSRRGTCNNRQRVTAPSILLGLGATIQGSVSLRFSFLLHYFSAPSEHFLRKGLSQSFALIPGGGHGTSSTHRRSINAARDGIHYTGLGKSTPQLSSVLLFRSIRAFSDLSKRTISNFRSNSWRGTCNY